MCSQSQGQWGAGGGGVGCRHGPGKGQENMLLPLASSGGTVIQGLSQGVGKRREREVLSSLTSPLAFEEVTGILNLLG